MKTAFIIFFIICVVVFAYFISIGFYQPLALPLACFLTLITYVFFRGDKNTNRIKNLLLISSLVYITSSLIWPKYVALRPPGLPPIGIQRFANLLALSSLVFAMFCSNWFRKEIANSFHRAKAFWIFLGMFVLFRFASVFVSPRPFSSAYIFLSDLFVHWPFIFAGILIGSSYRNLTLFSKIIACCFFINFFIVLSEYALGKNLFLQFVNTSIPELEWIMAEKTRSGFYRAQSIFTHSIVFAEFTSVSFCFTIFILSRIKNIIWRYITIISAVLCASAMVIMSGSRAGYIGTAIAVSLAAFSPLINSLFRRQMNLKIIALWSFLIIVVVVAVGALGLVVYDYALGKYADAASDNARILMLERTFDKLIESPIVGHGPGLGAELVGVEANRSVSAYTIDCLYISYTVDSGLFAVISFTALLIIGVTRTFRTSFYGNKENWLMWYMISLSIIVFALFKIILSLIENNFLLFVILGISVSETAQSGKIQKYIRGA